MSSVALVLLVLTHDTSIVLGADPFADFGAYAARALTDWNTPAMAVAVVKDGRVVFARGYGVRKVGRKDAVDADTIFPIASITKSFNATAIAMLVEEGKLDWMDPVAKHMPEFQLRDPWCTREVRIADLLSHRTGLADPDALCASGEFTREELLRRARFLPQVAPFRAGYRYNNLGPIIAGEILERVTGQSWSDFVRRRIIRPLEMRSTVPDVLELQGAENVATSYVSVSGKLEEDKSWNLPLGEGWIRYRETIRPSGAICSTANDMAKFALFQLSEGEFHGRRLLSAETIRQMQALHSVVPLKKPPVANLTYANIVHGAGFGWEIRDYRGRKLVMHRGSTGTVVGLVPGEQIGVVVLTNLGCGIQYMVMHDIIDRLLGIPRSWQNRDFIAHVVDDYQKLVDAANARLDRERDKDAAPKFELADYAGTYQSKLYGELIVEEIGNALSMRFGPNCHSRLVHWSGERFRATFVLRFPEDWFVSFAREGDRVRKVTVANVFPKKKLARFTRVSD